MEAVKQGSCAVGLVSLAPPLACHRVTHQRERDRETEKENSHPEPLCVRGLLCLRARAHVCSLPRSLARSGLRHACGARHAEALLV
eukprot:COSAG03_NODE_508_length_7337_cov_6.411854_3_plen_86_part_00